MKPSAFTAISEQGSGSTLNSSAIESTQSFLASAQAVISGTASGTLKIQASNDIPPGGINNVNFAPTNWVNIPSATVNATTPGSFLIPKTDICYRWIRANWTSNNSGDGVAASKIIQDLTYTAVTAGAGGNDLTITYVDPGTINHALTVAVVGTAITVTLATNGSSVITTTATLLSAAINASIPASALVSSSISGTGSNVQTAQSLTSLEGGINAGLVQVNMKVLGA